jgi:hypothetical protein
MRSIPVFVRSETCEAFRRPNTGAVGSNPARGMDVRVSLCCALLCRYRGLATGRSPVQGVLPKYLKEFLVSELNCELEQVRGSNP